MRKPQERLCQLLVEKSRFTCSEHTIILLPYWGRRWPCTQWMCYPKPTWWAEGPGVLCGHLSQEEDEGQLPWARPWVEGGNEDIV